MNAIVTLVIGSENPEKDGRCAGYPSTMPSRSNRHQLISEHTLPTIKAYADRIGAELVVLRTPSMAFPEFEKLQLRTLFNKYQRIILLDVDLIIRDDCPNLFDVVPEDMLGAYNDGAFNDYTGDMRDIVKTTGWEVEKWQQQFYNTGVVVASRRHKFLFDPPGLDVGDRFEPFWNLRVIRKQTKVFELNYKFNRMQNMDLLTGEHRLDSYIVHYAGAGQKIPFDVLMDNIRKDIAAWKEKSPKYEYKRHILIKTHGGLGDEICAEPVIRHIMEKAYPDADITVATWFPRLFEHLPVKIVDIMNYRLEPDTPYYLMETLVSPEHPSWKYYSANLMHATDFISQSCLRSVMPDKDKQIRLKVRFEELAEAMDAIGVQDLSNLVLVHPGKGWPSKTFPSSWWSTTIERIAAKGFKIVVIGKYLSDEQGTVDVTLPDGAVDARNLLSLGALIALISQARVLVSNDSAPIHIAGAFDNHIILIPSCKHPDHVIPLRNGIRYYKAEALCKRLMVDDIDSTPTQVHGQTIDKVRGDILDYLPDSNTVAEAVAKAMAAGTEGTKQEPVI